MTAISYVKYLQDVRATDIKISPIFILLKKFRSSYQIYLYRGLVYLSPILCYYMCVTQVLCPPRAKSWRRHCLYQFFYSSFTAIINYVR